MDRAVGTMIKLKIVKVVGDYCDGCFFLDDEESCLGRNEVTGNCSSHTREDGENVIFKELKEAK